MTRSDLLLVERPERRLDLFLAKSRPDLSRSQVQRLIKQGHALVDGRSAKASLTLEARQVVTLTLPPPTPSELQPEYIPLEVVYEDSDILVIDKPAGLTVHPAPGHPRGTLVNALLAYCPDLQGIGGELRPGIVHRLDKDTSGLMVVAKNQAAHVRLSRDIKERRITKGYIALVNGAVKPPEGTIDAPIGRDPRNRKRMALVEGGRASVTGYRVRELLRGCTLLEVHPLSGRTHQIRVHFASWGHPLVGDSTYGKKTPGLDRHFLHAHLLGFDLPSTGVRREFHSGLPPDLQAFLDQMTL